MWLLYGDEQDCGLSFSGLESLPTVDDPDIAIGNEGNGVAADADDGVGDARDSDEEGFLAKSSQPVRVRLWLFRLALCEKLLPHTSHWKGFSPVCTLMCVFKFPRWANVLLHTVQ